LPLDAIDEDVLAAAVLPLPDMIEGLGVIPDIGEVEVAAKGAALQGILQPVGEDAGDLAGEPLFFLHDGGRDHDRKIIHFPKKNRYFCRPGALYFYDTSRHAMPISLLSCLTFAALLGGAPTSPDSLPAMQL